MDTQPRHEPEHKSGRDPMFDALRAEMDTLQAPRGVEKELMQAFATQFPRKRRWYRLLAPRGWALGGGLAGATLALMLAVLVPQDPRTEALSADQPARISYGDDGGLFVALDSAERIEREPAPRMVETEVARSSLAALGLPLTPDNAGDTVKAELLVASDGQALAIRLSTVPDDRRITN
jgi:hypothetical protein